MKHLWPSVIFLSLIFTGVSADAAEGQGPVEKFVDNQIDKIQTGCKTELDTYCKDVTPGEGRVAACIYAHNDKLSIGCESALYSSSAAFQNAAQNLNAFAVACEADIKEFCFNIVLGEGRILDCLIKNKDKIAPACLENVQKAGLDYGTPEMMK